MTNKYVSFINENRKYTVKEKFVSKDEVLEIISKFMKINNKRERAQRWKSAIKRH